ncbi:hypothetical protein HELRODRAFT_164286 [Helobdella robusta]|uniref:Uncharacterized protein n=1 Tax=Helobdella robusta TaxID=6412 RepID=T1EV76_HELRO|nr:hypothetical protein HELRODRAFT_164286 [Helobdella robusta]ESN94442.1 hypothetical protein HELRODRAFT_164286 [Helobdella robusta]
MKECPINSIRADVFITNACAIIKGEQSDGAKFDVRVENNTGKPLLKILIRIGWVVSKSFTTQSTHLHQNILNIVLAKPYDISNATHHLSKRSSSCGKVSKKNNDITLYGVEPQQFKQIQKRKMFYKVN